QPEAEGDVLIAAQPDYAGGPYEGRRPRPAVGQERQGQDPGRARRRGICHERDDRPQLRRPADRQGIQGEAPCVDAAGGQPSLDRRAGRREGGAPDVLGLDHWGRAGRTRRTSGGSGGSHSRKPVKPPSSPSSLMKPWFSASHSPSIAASNPSSATAARPIAAFPVP